MNIDTGEIKDASKLTTEEKNSGRWIEIDGTESKAELKEKRRLTLLKERTEAGCKPYRWYPKNRSKYTPHTGGGQYKETK